MKRYLHTIMGVVISAAILMPLSAFAVPLSGAGATNFPISGTTVAARPELAGTVLEDKITEFTITGAGETLSGTIQNRVVRSIDGTLDFYWRILPTSGNGDLQHSCDCFEGFLLTRLRIDGWVMLHQIQQDILVMAQEMLIFFLIEMRLALAGGYTKHQCFSSWIQMQLTTMRVVVLTCCAPILAVCHNLTVPLRQPRYPSRQLYGCLVPV